MSFNAINVKGGCQTLTLSEIYGMYVNCNWAANCMVTISYTVFETFNFN